MDRKRYASRPNSRLIGSVIDPHTGERVALYACPRWRRIPYRKADGSAGDLSSQESDEAWPDGGLWDLSMSNGRIFGENYYDRDGWWSNTDVRFMPIAGHLNRGWLLNFVIQMIEGMRNGYPIRDVLAFATRWSLRDR